MSPTVAVTAHDDAWDDGYVAQAVAAAVLPACAETILVPDTNAVILSREANRQVPLPPKHADVSLDHQTQFIECETDFFLHLQCFQLVLVLKVPWKK